MSTSSRQLTYLITVLLSGAVLSGCTTNTSPAENIVQPSQDLNKPTIIPTPASKLTQDEARAIALASDCNKFGNLSTESFYNPHSQTWWFDLDQKKTGCNPACVVQEVTQQATVNWRCTGGLAPIQPVSK